MKPESTDHPELVPDEKAVLARLSVLDRFLPLGRFFPAIQGRLDAVTIGRTSLPIALGLLLMMYPVLAKVHYEELGRVARDRRLLRLSLLLVWGLGPALMFCQAWLFLPTQPAFRASYLKILPGWLGLATEDVTFSIAEIARAVLVFLGLPLLAGHLTRWIGLRLMGSPWYEQRFIPFTSHFALYGLLFTILVMFAL